VLQACRGVWVAHGSGAADRDVVDARDCVSVPPDRPAYCLRRVWLDAAEERGYYYGFANEGLWPLCHRVAVAPVFRADDFAAYVRVNERFAAAAVEEADAAVPVVLVQDYHFALAPRMIRRRLPHGTIVAFWHIPWPSLERLERCPWRHDLVRGLLGSTVLGFHTDEDREAFLAAAGRLLGADIDWRRGAVRCEGRETVVGAYPISIEWPSRIAGRAPAVDACRAAVRRRLAVDPETRLIVGVDRLDYTKGIREKALAVERLLETHVGWQGRVTFVQIAEPSRQCLPAYREARSEIVHVVERINRRFGNAAWQPIVLRESHCEPDEVYELLRAADVCYVGSLHDGMNLVAKEFAAARDDLRGVLVLSAFTGAARQLKGAVLVNPYAVNDSAAALARALGMSAGEQATRLRAMRACVAECNAYWWIGQMLQAATA
jgi:trehalose 6-phosphate synthase